MAAVRDLLAEGSFHESTVEEVAERAGISRATLYQHSAPGWISSTRSATRSTKTRRW